MRTYRSRPGSNLSARSPTQTLCAEPSFQVSYMIITLFFHPATFFQDPKISVEPGDRFEWHRSGGKQAQMCKRTAETWISSQFEAFMSPDLGPKIAKSLIIIGDLDFF